MPPIIPCSSSQTYIHFFLQRCKQRAELSKAEFAAHACHFYSFVRSLFGTSFPVIFSWSNGHRARKTFFFNPLSLKFQNIFRMVFCRQSLLWGLHLESFGKEEVVLPS